MAWFLSILTDNPLVRGLQLSLIGLAIVAIYLVFFTTRDILLRSRSFVYQVFCILLVTIFPILGFFLYLIVRPSTTLRERKTEELLKKLAKHLNE